MIQPGTASVSDLVRRINTLLETRLQISGLWIQGEVSGLTKHYSGHYYFTLKDENAQIACTMWKTYASRLQFELKEGMQVQVQGSVNVYEKSGRMNLNVRAMKPVGIGSLYLEMQARKEALAKAGYFDNAHKKPKPVYLEDIAVVTGKNTAALQDVLQTIARRWPMSKVHIYPALVQGQTAPASIMKALAKADAGGHDAILLVRGGGSFEDLFCFNDVDLVKAIYNTKTYIVTGIGHEVDYTLSDFVSDHRAVTPTAAAQFVTWDQNEIRAYLENEQQYLIRRMESLLSQSWQALSYVQNYPYFANPMAFLDVRAFALQNLRNELEKAAVRFTSYAGTVETMRQNLLHSMPVLLARKEQALQNASSRLQMAGPQKNLAAAGTSLQAMEQAMKTGMEHLLSSSQTRLENAQALLLAASPDGILQRGYARVEKDGQSISSLEQIQTNEQVRVVLYDGAFGARVTEKETN